MIDDVLVSGRALVDDALARLLSPETQMPESIHKAMRYSVFAGGKRLRPILCFEGARAISGSIPAGIEIVGAAIEMVHTYSLIHDDLPSFDDDDLRRGRPTCHVVFGEANAILAGDALQTLAYRSLASLPCAAERAIRIVGELATGTGTVDGMIGGQVVDIESEGKAPTEATVLYIHRAKTGALITSSLVMGAIYAGASPEEEAALRTFGRHVGLAFQIVDDVLDVTQTSEQLGKTAGKDLDAQKSTFPALFGVQESLRRANEQAELAWQALEPLGARADTLKSLAKLFVERKS